MHLVTFSFPSDLPEQHLLCVSVPSGLQLSTAHPHITSMLDLSSLEVVGEWPSGLEEVLSIQRTFRKPGPASNWDLCLLVKTCGHIRQVNWTQHYEWFFKWSLTEFWCIKDLYLTKSLFPRLDCQNQPNIQSWFWKYIFCWQFYVYSNLLSLTPTHLSTIVCNKLPLARFQRQTSPWMRLVFLGKQKGS